jgi:hypothetical protein
MKAQFQKLAKKPLPGLIYQIFFIDHGRLMNIQESAFDADSKKVYLP